MEPTYKATARIILFNVNRTISLLVKYPGPPQIWQILEADMETPGWETVASGTIDDLVCADIKIIPRETCNHIGLVRITGTLEPQPQQ